MIQTQLNEEYKTMQKRREKKVTYVRFGPWGPTRNLQMSGRPVKYQSKGHLRPFHITLQFGFDCALQHFT